LPKPIYGKREMKRFGKNMKNSIMRFYLRLLLINKLVLAAKARTNIGMGIKSM